MTRVGTTSSPPVPTLATPAGESAPAPLLDVRALTIAYETDERPLVRAVRDVSFSLRRGESLGLVGESGSGKTTIALSLMRLLPSAARVLGGEVLFEGRDVLALPQAELDALRWKSIAMAFQGAQNALNPVQRVEDQIAEPMTFHDGISKRAATAEARELLNRVGIEPSRGSGYPHEFSGGMRQRVVIAMALACNPKLLIADEPGTALDVVVQGQILELLLGLQEERHLAMLVISHDLSVIRFLTERCLVMYAGDLVEGGDTEELFSDPKHPYLEMLIRSFPTLHDEVHHLEAIPDRPPDLAKLPSGCPFHPRCPYAMQICAQEEPPSFDLGAGHFASCWRNDTVPHE